MFVQIRSKNDTASSLRGQVVTRKRCVLRLGSNTPTDQIFPVGARTGKEIIEINTVQACHNSGNKITMKQMFDAAGVITAEWLQMNSPELATWPHFDAIIKHKNSSKGEGIFIIHNQVDLDAFIAAHHNLQDFIIEKFYNYVKEYRLHVTKDGCFYTCRKMLKDDAVERWHRHDTNSVWILEENELFAKPANWDEIVAECVKAMTSVGLDISAIDIKVSNHNPARFIILETNSGPSMGNVTAVKYIDKLKAIVDEF